MPYLQVAVDVPAVEESAGREGALEPERCRAGAAHVGEGATPQSSLEPARVIAMLVSPAASMIRAHVGRQESVVAVDGQALVEGAVEITHAAVGAQRLLGVHALGIEVEVVGEVVVQVSEGILAAGGGQHRRIGNAEILATATGLHGAGRGRTTVLHADKRNHPAGGQSARSDAVRHPCRW